MICIAFNKNKNKTKKKLFIVDYVKNTAKFRKKSFQQFRLWWMIQLAKISIFPFVPQWWNQKQQRKKTSKVSPCLSLIMKNKKCKKIHKGKTAAEKKQKKFSCNFSSFFLLLSLHYDNHHHYHHHSNEKNLHE